MANTEIELDFGLFVLDAELFENSIGEKFKSILPCTIELTSWGTEVYGPTGKNLGTGDPIENIPEGGLAYTNNGNYFCVFFGQKPAWAVEYIGHIKGNQWQRLLKEKSLQSLTIRTRL